VAASVLAASVVIAPSAAASGAADSAGDNEGRRALTLIHVSDTHGKFVPHWEKLQDDKWHPGVGGFARTYTAVQRIRQQTAGRNLFLMNGDNFHSSGEMLFTRGRAGIPVMNKFQPDAYTPGNWDFAEGPQELRARFTGIPSGYPGETPGGKPLVNFPVLAAGVYNAPGAPAYAPVGKRLLPPYLFREINGVKVAIIGLNDDKPKDQAANFTIGLDLHAGFQDLPPLVRTVRAQGADLVVVMSETGLAQNIAMARDVPGVDVVFSADTHEETYRPVRVPSAVDPGHSTLVVESGEGSHIGRLDLVVGGSGESARITGSNWQLQEIDASVPEDPGMKTVVDTVRAPFLKATWKGPFTRAYPGGGKPLVLDRPLDTVIGTTDTDLERHSVYPTEGDAFIADAIWKLTGADVAGTNGFRYDIPIPAGEEITVGDVYLWLPLAAQIAVGDVTGSQLKDRFERYLSAVLDPNAYRRTGGWLPQMAGVRFSIDLAGPDGAGGDRIVKAEIYNRTSKTWEPLVDDRVYTMGGCYSPGDAMDRMCRTNGVRNMRFVMPDGSRVAPLVKEMLPSMRTTVRAAPDGVMSAPETLMAYIEKNHGVQKADLMGPTWIVVNGSLPVSAAVPDVVQPLAGSGPDWLAAPRVTQ
jgi:2',3'-cyclic-nucleotide 2'-phosphodiesterase (5'-nucleotidase family)